MSDLLRNLEEIDQETVLSIISIAWKTLGKTDTQCTASFEKTSLCKQAHNIQDERDFIVSQKQSSRRIKTGQRFCKFHKL
jgi:hypothetical protein